MTAVSREVRAPKAPPALAADVVAQRVAKHGHLIRAALSQLPRTTPRTFREGTGWQTVRHTFHEGSLKLEARPAARISCNRVFLLTAVDPAGERFRVVVKRDGHLPRTLANLERTRTHVRGPLREATRALHGVEDGWLVMEALDGAERDEVLAALDSDRGLAVRMARSVARILGAANREGLVCHDVSFLEGLNCLVDPGSGQVRFIELGGLMPDTLPRGEAIAFKLFTELRHAAELLESGQHPGALRYAYHLAREVLSRIREETLVHRPGFARPLPRHPTYLTDGFEGDEGGARRLQTMGAGTMSGLRSEVLSPALCEAVRSRDPQAFARELRMGPVPPGRTGGIHGGRMPRGIVPLSDPADRRAWVRFYDRKGRYTLKPPLR